jgi:hypothetical protein
MATFPIDVEFDFEDAPGRISRQTYRMDIEYNDVINNMDDVVAQAADLRAALQLLTWDKIRFYRVIVQADYSSAADPNIAANNQIHAFVRTRDENGARSSFDVPAWDDDVYAENTKGMLSPAFLTAAATVSALLRNPDTGDDIVGIDWAQSRTHKQRGSAPE